MENTEITTKDVLTPLSGVPGYLSITYAAGSTGGTFISTWAFSSSTGTPQYIRSLGGQSFNSNYHYTGLIRLSVTNTTNQEIICTPGNVSSTISSIGGTIYQMQNASGNVISELTLAAGATTNIVVLFRFYSTYTFPVIDYGYGTMRVNISMSIKGGVTGSYTIANVYDKYILAWK